MPLTKSPFRALMMESDRNPTIVTGQKEYLSEKYRFILLIQKMIKQSGQSMDRLPRLGLSLSPLLVPVLFVLASLILTLDHLSNVRKTSC